jgi:hypothetical protein
MTVNPTLLILLAEGFGLFLVAFITVGSVWLVRKQKQKRALRSMAARVNAVREARREEAQQIATAVLHLDGEEGERFAQELEQAERGFVKLVMTLTREGKAAQVDMVDGELFSLLDRYRSSLLSNAAESPSVTATNAPATEDEPAGVVAEQSELEQLNVALQDQLKTTTEALDEMVRASDATLHSEESDDDALQMLDGEDVSDGEQDMGPASESMADRENDDDISVSGAPTDSDADDDIEPTLAPADADLFGEPADGENETLEANDDGLDEPSKDVLSKAS